jgi:hypothetical protein
LTPPVALIALSSGSAAGNREFSVIAGQMRFEAAVGRNKNHVPHKKQKVHASLQIWYSNSSIMINNGNETASILGCK